MIKAIQHQGFAFLNVMSPCVTWRGDDQFKELKAKLRPIPADHDRTDRAAALATPARPTSSRPASCTKSASRPSSNG